MATPARLFRLDLAPLPVTMAQRTTLFARIVMAGLVRGLSTIFTIKQDVDARHKAAQGRA